MFSVIKHTLRRNKHPVIILLGKFYDLLILLISMAGYVPKNAPASRTLAMALSLVFMLYIGNYEPYNSSLAIIYFAISEFLYIGFLMLVLPGKGLRHRFARKRGNEDAGYRTYETLLGFLFFHNAASIGYIASSTPGGLFGFIHRDFLLIFVFLMFAGGFIIKILAAKAVTIEIYYWKDMFLGKKITDFVVTGPYKYFKNPMYGIGQVPAYATAIWYGSKYGLTAAFLNQALIFTFFFLVEKKFINRVYKNITIEKS